MEKNKKCNISNKCGSCNINNTDYIKSLEKKQKNVEKILKDKIKKQIKINKIIGMQNPYNYRNKGKYAFGYDEKKRPVMGFFEKDSHKIVSFDDCQIQDKDINQIAKFVFQIVKKYSIKIYNEDTQKGFLRHLIIRKGMFSNEIMVIFVTTDSKMFRRESVIKELIAKFPNIKTIVQNINSKKTNAILGDKNINLYGNGYIMDYLNGYKFKISPVSFYQVNSTQTEVLYNKAIEYANISNRNIVYDLYCGIGTISIIASKNAKKVYGIEIVNEAIRDAKENSRINKIKNTEFQTGRVEILLPKLVRSGIEADCVIVDPPRSGLDRKTIETLLAIKAKKIVYVSCNPESFAENLVDLESEYDIGEIQPVDMFPFTDSVECCSVLNIKNNK